jgi:hypothetical protein
VWGIKYNPPELRYAGQCREFEMLWWMLMSGWKKEDTVARAVR